MFTKDDNFHSGATSITDVTPFFPCPLVPRRTNVPDTRRGSRDETSDVTGENSTRETTLGFLNCTLKPKSQPPNSTDCLKIIIEHYSPVAKSHWRSFVPKNRTHRNMEFTAKVVDLNLIANGTDNNATDSAHDVENHPLWIWISVKPSSLVIREQSSVRISSVSTFMHLPSHHLSEAFEVDFYCGRSNALAAAAVVRKIPAFSRGEPFMDR